MVYCIYYKTINNEKLLCLNTCKKEELEHSINMLKHMVETNLISYGIITDSSYDTEYFVSRNCSVYSFVDSNDICNLTIDYLRKIKLESFNTIKISKGLARTKYYMDLGTRGICLGELPNIKYIPLLSIGEEEFKDITKKYVEDVCKVTGEDTFIVKVSSVDYASGSMLEDVTANRMYKCFNEEMNENEYLLVLSQGE